MNIDPSLQAFMNPYFSNIETTTERTNEELTNRPSYLCRYGVGKGSSEKTGSHLDANFPALRVL
jgi:hypothetical protein